MVYSPTNDSLFYNERDGWGTAIIRHSLKDNKKYIFKIGGNLNTGIWVDE